MDLCNLQRYYEFVSLYCQNEYQDLEDSKVVLLVFISWAAKWFKNDTFGLKILSWFLDFQDGVWLQLIAVNR